MAEIRKGAENWTIHQTLGANLQAILVRDAVPGNDDGGEFQFVQVNGQDGAVVRFDKYELTAFFNFLMLTMPDELADIWNLMGVEMSSVDNGVEWYWTGFGGE